MEVKITTICRTDKINKKNEAPIALKVSKNYQTKKKSLGININIDYWDFENGVLKNNAPNKEYIQLVIDSTIQELNKKILNYQIQNQEFTLDDLLDNPKKKSKTITIKDYFNQITIQLKEANKLSSASKYKFCLSSLSKYHSMDIPFTDIDLKFLIDFEVFLRKEGLANNSIATKFSTLKAAYNSALKQKFFSCEESPFTNYQVGKLWTNTQKRAIQKEDIYRIKELDLSNICKYPSPYLEFSRDIFLFSYFTAGINFIDIATLKYHDIDNSHIYYSRHKTQKNMKATLLPDALVILKKYMKEEATKDDYIFPILDKQIHITKQQQYNRILKARRKINKNLKIIGKELNINIQITTYVARHTFATVLKRSGVNIGIISESLGHSDLKTTQIYLDSFENSEIDAAMKNLL
ncbi:site-specific integrase [Butyricimonas sp. An62]|uniref:site-specific integrase n=3 Tax=Butyricimonas TaxID=574697 RepID=UPI000B3694E1|nr:site-specific integrase [Butyricimonas sp. An62]MBS7198581.1 site-specific integrase [Bacteroidales bacterium]OUN64232.1 recombinase XerD [Butyricimonas sp. An62]